MQAGPSAGTGQSPSRSITPSPPPHSVCFSARCGNVDTEVSANKKAESRDNHERIHVCGGFSRDKSEPVSLPW